jgi:hypothetical protein
MQAVDLTYRPYPNKQDFAILCEEKMVGKITKQGFELYFN